MNDLSKVLIGVSNLDANFVNRHARTPGGIQSQDVKFEVEFKPEEEMTGFQAASAMAIILNVVNRGEPMSPEEYENLPASVANFFHQDRWRRC